MFFCCVILGTPLGVFFSAESMFVPVFGVFWLVDASCSAAVIVGFAFDGGVGATTLFLMCCGGMVTLRDD